jgi:hypothetical protein
MAPSPRWPSPGSARLALGVLAAVSGALAGPSTEAVPQIVRKPMSLSTQMDFGQIVQGRGDGSQAGDLSGQFLQRTGAWLTQETIIRQRLSVKVGAGGMFWYSLPEAEAGEEGIHKIRTKFGPGVSQAQAIYAFGDPKAPSAQLQMGLFPYKYNPDAQNLGEYLLRSGAYPNILRTGGWNLVSSASVLVQGLRLSLPIPAWNLRSDFLLPLERDLPPLYDISPTWVTTWKPAAGFELGGGICWSHGIPVKPSRTSPRDPGFQEVKNPGNAYLVPIPNPDTSRYGKGPNVYVRDTTRFYTFQGIKLMARASLDPQTLLGFSGPFGPQDLKLYAEAALLGVKNYPVLYENRSERIPVMVGFNFPAFGFLDVLGVEFEHFGSRFPNNIYQVYNNRLPIPQFISKFTSVDTLGHYDPADPAFKQDDWKWSVYARKRIYGGLRVHAQAANDHMRPTEYNLQPFWVPITNRAWKDWYYLFRLELGV